jgi:hypothetical protein
MSDLTPNDPPSTPDAAAAAGVPGAAGLFPRADQQATLDPQQDDLEDPSEDGTYDPHKDLNLPPEHSLR